MDRQWPEELVGIGLAALCAPNRLDQIARAYEQAAASSPYLLRYFSLKASIFRVDDHRDPIVTATSRQKVAKARHLVESAKTLLIQIVRDSELDRCKSKLNRLREYDVKYSEAVATENAATSECLRIEEMGFEAMESIEIERLLRIFDASRWDFYGEFGEVPNPSIANILDVNQLDNSSPKSEQQDNSGRTFDDPSALIRKFSSSFAFGTSNGQDSGDLLIPSLDDVLSEETRILRSRSHCPERLEYLCRLQKAVDAAIKALLVFSDTPIQANDCLPDIYVPIWEYFEIEKGKARDLTTTLHELSTRLEEQRGVLERNEASWKQLCDATRSPLRQRTHSWDKGASVRKDVEIPTQELIELSSDAFRQSANDVISMLAREDTIKKELEAAFKVSAARFPSAMVLTRDQISESMGQWSERLQENAAKRLTPLEYKSLLSESLRKSVLELTPPPSPASVAVPENSASKWFSSMISDSSESLFGSRKAREGESAALVDIETRIFRECFCKGTLSCLVLRSVACACERHFGRLFLLHSPERGSTLVFVSWKGHQVVFQSGIASSGRTGETEDKADSRFILLRNFTRSYQISHFSSIEMAQSLVNEWVKDKQNVERNSPNENCNDANQEAVEVKNSHCNEEDLVVKRMEPILSAEIHDASLTDYYEKVWSESTPFYKPWLEEQSFDVELEPWVKEEAQNEWSQETYQRHRECRFKFRRKTHLYIGPPIARVKQVRAKRLCVLLRWY